MESLLSQEVPDTRDDYLNDELKGPRIASAVHMKNPGVNFAAAMSESNDEFNAEMDKTAQEWHTAQNSKQNIGLGKTKTSSPCLNSTRNSIGGSPFR
jgi:hypothetical protein